ncbi:hypothetical protein BHE74_00030336 [Ensete ventricosum]|nr:hypothetical protein GW17_00036871 [Ensete ventricosum]RWW62525.1 hypothetical protein BHE74_00030336 [Ensete ventricosum]RZS16683.1 hypothetical protein BHM03_00048716 [Ensete ventricosum]
MTALSLLRIGQPMITLYAEGSSTTMKGNMRVLVHIRDGNREGNHEGLGSPPKVTGRVATPTGAITSPVNPVKVEVMVIRSLLIIPSF